MVKRKNTRRDQAEAAELAQAFGELGVPRNPGQASRGVWRAQPDPNGNRAARRAWQQQRRKSGD